MTDRDKKFVKMLVDLDAKVMKSRRYVKENFNVDSEYNSDTNSIKLTCNNVSESLNLLSARKYIEDEFDGIISVEF